LGEDEIVNTPLDGDDYPAVENIPTSPTPENEVSDLPTEIVTGENVTPIVANPDNVWYEVKRILKTKRQRGKDLCVVEWADSLTNSWVERKDLTDYALQAFYASRPPRRRHRRLSY